MVLTRLAVSLLFLSLTRADVKFTAPVAGSVVGGNSLTARWEESGVAPQISQFESYSLFLCAGGNEESNYIPLANLEPYGTFAGGNAWTGAINTGWGANDTDAYFLKMIGSACGGTVVNYSPRFSISSMSGTFPQDVQNAVAPAIKSNGTAGPETEESNVVASSCKTISIPSTSVKTSTSPTAVHASPTTISSAAPTTAAAVSNESTISLSSGALAGLIVGVIIAFSIICACVVLLFLCIRRRRPGKNNVPKLQSLNLLLRSRRRRRGTIRLASTDTVNELDAHAVCKELPADKTYPQETAGTPVSELPTRKSMKSVYEMAAD